MSPEVFEAWDTVRHDRDAAHPECDASKQVTHSKRMCAASAQLLDVSCAAPRCLSEQPDPCWLTVPLAAVMKSREALRFAGAETSACQLLAHLVRDEQRLLSFEPETHVQPASYWGDVSMALPCWVPCLDFLGDLTDLLCLRHSTACWHHDKP